MHTLSWVVISDYARALPAFRRDIKYMASERLDFAACRGAIFCRASGIIRGPMHGLLAFEPNGFFSSRNAPGV